MIKQEVNACNNQYWMDKKTLKRTIPLHWHTYYELELILEGEGTHICNSVASSLKKGTVFVLSPQDFHQIDCLNDNEIHVISLCFQEEIFSSEVRHAIKNNPPPYILNISDTMFDATVSDLMFLNEVLTKNYKYRDIIACRLIELILIKIMENSRNNKLSFAQNDQMIKSLHDLQPIIKYINTHYSESLNREELAQMVHLSPSYLSSTFKKTFGISLSDYIINCRMKNAKSLLKHSDESIKNTIEMVGYNSPSLFYRHFYKYYGVKPSDMQKSKK